jgi:hypothetical protein
LVAAVMWLDRVGVQASSVLLTVALIQRLPYCS